MPDLKTWALTIGAGAVCGVLLVACDPNDDDKAVIQRDQNGQKTGLIIFTDSVNGCQYVRTFQRSGITPRLGRDGKQMCGQ